MNHQTWKIRLLFALGLIGLAGYFLVPSVIYFSLTDAQVSEVRKSKGAFEKYVPSWAPTTHIVPGLDLQGGVHMVLGIDLDKAVSDKARRISDRLRKNLEEESIKTKSITHLVDEPPGDRIKVVFADADGRAKFEKEMMKSFGDLAIVSSSGAEILFRVHPNYLTKLKSDAVDQTRKTIESRINKMGITEPIIAKRGDDQIQIQLPGYDDPEEAKSLIGRTAQLEFQMCDDTSDFLTKLTDLPAGVTVQKSSYQKKSGGYGNNIYLDFDADKLPEVKEYLRGKAPSGLVVKYGKLTGAPGSKERMRTYTLFSRVELTGDQLADASVSVGAAENNFQPAVSLEFTPTGGKTFGDLTARSIGKRMAIVLEDNVDSAPVIQSAIRGGTAQITMGGSRTQQEMRKDAQQLALVLKAGALPAPVQFREERSVGPSLGKDAVAAGKTAFAVGGILVLLFMLIYYRVAGLIAGIGIAVNMVFVLGTISWLGGTVTLPGLAGLLLTIGMAVDANIIITERIREELRAGKRPQHAITVGYDEALSAIIDANVTTFIAGMVLWQFGTGPIQNFATTLLIGTISSVVSAVFVTRIFFDMVASRDPDNIAI